MTFLDWQFMEWKSGRMDFRYCLKQDLVLITPHIPSKAWCLHPNSTIPATFLTELRFFFSFTGYEFECIHWFPGGHHYRTLPRNLSPLYTTPIKISSQANNSNRFNVFVPGCFAWSWSLQTSTTIWMHGSVSYRRSQKGILVISLPLLLFSPVFIHCPSIYQNDIKTVARRSWRELTFKWSDRGSQEPKKKTERLKDDGYCCFVLCHLHVAYVFHLLVAWLWIIRYLMLSFYIPCKSCTDQTMTHDDSYNIF